MSSAAAIPLGGLGRGGFRKDILHDLTLAPWVFRLDGRWCLIDCISHRDRAGLV